MTPEQRYQYDVDGYLLIEDAISPDYLADLNQRLDHWEAKTSKELDRQNPIGRFDDILNHEESLLPLVDNPILVPYIDQMIRQPRLKSTWVTFQHRSGRVHFHSNHTPAVTHNHYYFDGAIRHNLFQVFYALKDIGPGQGALEVVPGSHKANYPLPDMSKLEHMKREIPMKAGAVLIFTHDMHHGSLNTSDQVRRTLIFTYCPGEIANSFGGDGLYDRLFSQTAEGSWRKYLLRPPNGFRETYPKPDHYPVERHR